MHFSGKITNSVLNYLERQGLGLETVFEVTHLPTEFLRDPSSWIEARDVESFLAEIDKAFTPSLAKGSEPLLTQVGHHALELKAWGALDSVLRMVESPSDIFSQPKRFISYFVSPEPPVEQLDRTEASTSFNVPIYEQDFPKVCEYLKAAMEALPLYQGQAMAHVTWSEYQISIRWEQKQNSLFGEGDVRGQLKPEFMASLVETIERSQKQIEEKRQELTEKDQEIEKLRHELLLRAVPESSSLSEPLQDGLKEVEKDILRLADYLGRSQQLVTLLVVKNRLDRQVQEAMRRMDWGAITSLYPKIVEQSLHKLSHLAEGSPASIQTLGFIEDETSEVAKSTDVNQMLEGLLSQIGSEIRPKAKIEKLLFLDRPVPLQSASLQAALKPLIKEAWERLSAKGRIRIVTRPVNGRAELEISEIRTLEDHRLSEKGSLIERSQLDHLEQIVKDHQGRFSLQSRGPEGSTILIQFPT